MVATHVVTKGSGLLLAFGSEASGVVRRSGPGVLGLGVPQQHEAPHAPDCPLRRVPSARLSPAASTWVFIGRGRDRLRRILVSPLRRGVSPGAAGLLGRGC